MSTEPTQERVAVCSEKEILLIFVGVIPFHTLVFHSLLPFLHERGEAERCTCLKSMQQFQDEDYDRKFNIFDLK